MALGIFGLVLVCCEIGARFALPEIPGSSEITRNPFRFRGWPEYVSGSRDDPSVGTVVLLTNSQGYAGELSHHKIYPARLEALLNQHKVGGRSRWEVLNWSSDGITSIELMLLVAHLQDRVSGIVLAVTGYADHAVEHSDAGLLYCRSDIPRLAARCRISRRLPRSYWRRHVKGEDLLTFFLRDKLALLRYREYAWSWLETRLPGIHETFYAPSVNYLPWTMRGKPRVKPLRKPANRSSDPSLTYGEESRQMLREYVMMMSRIPARVVVVSEPIRIRRSDTRRRWHDPFQDDLAALVAEHGVTFWDLSRALPAEGFATSSHFHPSNHELFADVLLERITAELGEESN